MPAEVREYKTLKEFWPFYLTEHANRTNRNLHAIGSLLVIGLMITSLAMGNYWLLLALPVGGYGFAWLGHYVFEKNRPATFTYPFMSFVCDWIMLYYVLTFQVDGELEKARKALGA